MPFFRDKFSALKRDLIVIFKIILSGLTAGFLIFFISALSGTDLKKNTEMIKDLENMYAEINAELETGVAKRLEALGEVPEINPYRKVFCAELAKEIHEISYLTEKQKIMFDAFNVRDFEYKAQQLISYSDSSDVKSLYNELEIVKRELKNSANLIANKQKILMRQRTAYIVFFFLLWIVVYTYYSRGIIRKYGQR
jgi:Fe2+ transport system protein B